MADSTPTYQVLARKYRPQRFDDLIGQDAMVTTLTNAFKTGRIAHAFMLTGVRGVGKTTTARLLARALNYRTSKVDAPSISLDPPGDMCARIAAGRHPDVMEMDAASRTGVNDIREILDGVSYSPGEARFKIYVIDEVHMLSTSAFNALLKTLEEPPAHAKFIFATTEIRKVPVTVLSRCQRFDLKRVDPEVLTDYLASICEKEGAKVDEDGLKLIARAGEGSVRDALSLLDQAIVQGGDGKGKAISATAVRDMLGLADRSATFDILSGAMRGDGAAALAEFDRQYAAGAEPVTVMRDLLDHCHAVTRAKALGEAARFTDAADYVARVREVAAGIEMGALSRVWQMLLKAHEETRTAPDPRMAAEMAILRVAHAASVPPPEEAMRILAGHASATDNQGAGAGATASAERMPSHASSAHTTSATTASAGGLTAVAQRVDPSPDQRPQPDETPGVDQDEDDAPRRQPAADGQGVAIRTLADVSALAEANRDLLLKAEIDRGMRPARIEPGKIVYAPTDYASEELSAKLSKALREWTGERWFVSAERNASQAETLSEQRKREQAEHLAATKADPAVAAAFDLWPEAEIVSIRDRSDDPREDGEGTSS